MPKKPPQPENQTQRKRAGTPDIPGYQAEKKFAGGPVVPEIPGSGPGQINPWMVIPVAGELDGVKVDNIRVWKLRNPNLPVEVMLDPDSILVGKLMRYIVLWTKLELEANGVYGVPSRELGPDDPDTVRYQVLKRKQQAFYEIDTDRSAHGKTWGEAIEDWLIARKNRSDYFSPYAPGQGEIDQIREQQASLIERLEGDGITVSNAPLSFPAGYGFEDIYHGTVYKWGSLQDGENLLRAERLYENGGISVDWRRLPALNEALFSELQSSLSAVEWVDAQFAIAQMALDQWEQAEPGKFPGRAAKKEAGFPDYRAVLEKWADPNRGRAVLRQINDIVNRYPNGGVFSQLDHVYTDESGLLMGGLDGRTAINPAAIAAREGSPVLKRFLDDYGKTYQLIDRSVEFRAKVAAIRKGYIEKWSESDGAPTRADLKKFGDDRAKARADFNAEVAAHNPDKHYARAIDSQPYAGMDNVDLEGHLSGAAALLHSYQQIVGSTSPGRFTGSTALTEAMDQRGSPEIYTFDDHFVYQPLNNSKRVVIVQLSDDRAIARFSSDLYNRYGSSRINTRDSPSVAWWLWDRQQQKLKLYGGQDFTMESGDKLLLVGHGTGDLPSTDGTRKVAMRIAGLSDDDIINILKGTNSESSVHTILPDPAARPDFVLRKVENVACETCDKGFSELAPGTSRELHPVEHDFINPRLLKRFIEQGYRVGKIVGSPDTVIVGGHGDRYSYEEKDSSGEPVHPVLQHKLAGHWYEYRAAGVREDGDPVIRVTSKPTSDNSKGQSHYTGTHLARAQSSESAFTDQLSAGFTGAYGTLNLLSRI